MLNSVFEQYEAMVRPCFTGHLFSTGRDFFYENRLREIMLVANRLWYSVAGGHLWQDESHHFPSYPPGRFHHWTVAPLPLTVETWSPAERVELSEYTRW